MTRQNSEQPYIPDISAILERLEKADKALDASTETRKLDPVDAASKRLDDYGRAHPQDTLQWHLRYGDLRHDGEFLESLGGLSYPQLMGGLAGRMLSPQLVESATSSLIKPADIQQMQQQAAMYERLAQEQRTRSLTEILELLRPKPKRAKPKQATKRRIEIGAPARRVEKPKGKTGRPEEYAWLDEECRRRLDAFDFDGEWASLMKAMQAFVRCTTGRKKPHPRTLRRRVRRLYAEWCDAKRK